MKNLIYSLLATGLLVACQVEESDVFMLEQLELEKAELERLLLEANAKVPDTVYVTNTVYATETVTNTQVVYETIVDTVYVNQTTGETTSSNQSGNNYATASYEVPDVTEMPTDRYDWIEMDFTANHDNGDIAPYEHGIAQKDGTFRVASDRFGNASSSLYSDAYQCEPYLYKAVTMGDLFTISFWVAPYGESCDDSSLIKLTTLYTSGRHEVTTEELGLEDSRWHNIIIRSDGTTYHVYKDGNKVSEHGYGESGGLRRIYLIDKFAGFIDDIIIWSRELNYKEIEYVANN